MVARCAGTADKVGGSVDIRASRASEPLADISLRDATPLFTRSDPKEEGSGLL
jgi:hypothetical protein